MFGDDAGDLGGTSVFDADIFVTLQRVDQKRLCLGRILKNFNEQDYSMNMENELAAALRNLLWQTKQMRGMFRDEDGTIEDAVNDAENAMESYEKARALKST